MEFIAAADFAEAPTRALARFASRFDSASLGAGDRTEVIHHVTDTLAACVAGAAQPIVQAVARVGGASRLAVTEGVPVIGTAWRCEPLDAAYLLAAAAHALEMDDGNREGSIHPGTTVIPAALAVGYASGARFSDLLAATVAGYEVAVSIAEILHPHASRRGFQTTPVAGTMGAAAAAARLLGLDADGMENALGIAASASSGIFAYLTGGGNIKKLHPAHAAREGVLAALYAQQGVVQGPSGVRRPRPALQRLSAPHRSDLAALRRRRHRPGRGALLPEALSLLPPHPPRHRCAARPPARARDRGGRHRAHRGGDL